MMTHAFYGGGGDYDYLYRSNNRHMSQASYHSRVAPYAYYDRPARRNSRSEYVSGPMTRTIIHEPEDPGLGEQRARKRISVACRRCRKKKIKCSGDLGDGLGCSACRHAGADGAQCAFIRVGAKECSEVLPGMDMIAINDNVHTTFESREMMDSQDTTTFGSRSSNTGYEHTYQGQRPSLTTPQTRPQFSQHDPHYEQYWQDHGGHIPSIIPRQDSCASSYGLENYRSWPTTGTAYASITAPYYEQIPAYSFGSLQAPTYNGRLPSMSCATPESIALFQMGPLDSSLPVHTMQERRLPVPAPYTLQYPPAQQHMPQIRPLGSFSEPRVHINGIHSRNAMPWSHDAHPATTHNYASSSGLPVSSTQGTGTISEPVLGYEFNTTAPHTESSSPATSPTSAAAPADSLSSGSSTGSMPPQPNFRYAQVATTSAAYHDSSMSTAQERHACSRLPPSLYSFSTESAERSTPSNLQDNDDTLPGSIAYSSPSHQPLDQHGPERSMFTRRPSYDEQRASTAHRMSLSHLNASY